MKIFTDISPEDESYLPQNIKVVRMEDKAISNPIAVIDLDETAIPKIIHDYVLMNKSKAKVINMFSPEIKNHA